MKDDALLDWLLEPANPSARAFALRDLMGRTEQDDEVVVAREAIMSSSPVRAILDAQYPDGYWVKPDRGYSPKYKASIWQLIFLADLGASRTEPIARACEHVMDAALRPDLGLFSAHKHSSGVFPCLNGDLLRALYHLGYDHHPTVLAVTEALAQRVLSDGLICVRNGAQIKDKGTWQPCAWGCVRVLRGFAAIPVGERSPIVCRAIERGVAFLLSLDLARDHHPLVDGASGNWLRFGFPSSYESDLLEALLALAELGVRAHLPAAVQIVLEKRDASGRWTLERALRSWADFGTQGEPNKWITLRALKVLGWFS